jgi:hypothetical protein
MKNIRGEIHMKKNTYKIISSVLALTFLCICFGSNALPSKSNSEKTMIFSFSDLELNEASDYLQVNIGGSDALYIKDGFYMVPTVVETLCFPMGSEIISVEGTPGHIHRETVSKNLRVAPEPSVLGLKGDTGGDEAYLEPKSVDQWCIYDIGCGLIENKRNIIVKVQIFPVQYTPSKHCLDWAENIEVTITYKEPEGAFSYNDAFAFVIISPDTYCDELQDLVVHKNSLGVSTKLVSFSEIFNGDFFPAQGRDDAETIKYFIKEAIENWGISSVLLVGDSETFPTRYVHIRTSFSGGMVFVSDLYYADIYNETGFSSWDTNNNNIFGEYIWGDYFVTDNLDLYPDVTLGRIACINEEQVVTCVNKIIAYEENDAWAQEWFTDIVSIGGDTFPFPLSDIIEGEYGNDMVVDILDGFVPDRIWASNKRLLGGRGVQNIEEAINGGAGFVDFQGHGSPDGWSTHPADIEGYWIPEPKGYRNYHVANLTNGDKLPIVTICACGTSNFVEDNNCLGWSFISNPHGGGIASLSASETAYGARDEEVTEVYFGKMIMNAYKAYSQGASSFGEMWSTAIHSYIFPDMDRADLLTVEEWQSFGDPTLRIAGESVPPKQPGSPDGPSSGGVSTEYIYTASTSDPDDDQLYYLFDWGNGDVSGWLGPYTSDEPAEASYTWEKRGNFEIRVKAKDEHGVMGEWSDPLSVTIPKAKYRFDLILTRFVEQSLTLFPRLNNIMGLMGWFLIS